jgi:pimeloyl-ACP methyl ester carboxylesterase
MSSEHEATVDICLNLQAVRNIGEHYLSRSYFTLALTAGPHLAVPYQIIPQRTPSLSSITLLTYVSPLLSLAPYASYQYSELAVFKALVPISQLESEGLQVSCVLYEASGEEAQEVDRVQLEYVSILGLNSFMPICFMESRCVIDAVITTQLLTCRFKNILTLPKPLLYCAIEALLIAFNRLREKLHKCRQSCEFEVENFPELEDIRRFTKIRIFQYPEEEQRAKLLEFERKIPNISFCVQQLWSQYLSCELSSDLERYRSNFLKSYALQVKQNVFVREKAEEATYIVDGLRVFSSPISVKTLFKREAESFQKGDGSTQHLLILVHGYGASSKTLEQLELALRCFFPHLLIITSKINENRTDDSLDELGKRLSLEVESSMLAFKAEDNFSLSFIAHSMGGLIVRAALKYLEAHKYSMRLFISLGTPHLGFLYHNSRMTKFGMWAYNLLKKSPSMGAMMMDNPTGNYRSSYLYALSNAVGLDWFEEALFYAGSEDYYVSEESALVETNAAILEDQGRGLEKPMIWQEMRENLEKSLQHVGVGKYLVDFEKSNELEEGSLFDEFLGRRNHINLATSGAFVIALLLNHSNLL